MKKAVGVVSLTSGALLLMIPRFILPVCEYAGYQPMHCSGTARAEYIVGAVLIVAGAGTFVLRHAAAPLIAAVTAFVLSAAAYAAPNIYGYCRSAKMPCNYGTVPAVRFVAVVTAAIIIIATVHLIRKRTKARSS
jgi:ascorbate-specific PTS system EIIC-type component UlaA